MLGEKIANPAAMQLASVTNPAALQVANIQQASAMASNFPMEAATSQFDAKVKQDASATAVNMLAGGAKECNNLSFESNFKKQAPAENIVNSGPKFAIGDRVKIVGTKESCMSLQAGHGGWHPSMSEVRRLR